MRATHARRWRGRRGVHPEARGIPRNSQVSVCVRVTVEVCSCARGASVNTRPTTVLTRLPVLQLQ
jgi:hypothetical protein